MKNKKLSHNGLQGSVTSVMAALLCILIGLAVGFLVLLDDGMTATWGQEARPKAEEGTTAVNSLEDLSLLTSLISLDYMVHDGGRC